MENKIEEVELAAKYNTLLEKNRKLIQRISNLESELLKKNTAIAAFKEWQKEVTSRNAKFWIDRYMSQESDPVEIKKYRQISKMIVREDNFVKELRQIIESIRNRIITHKEEMTPERIEFITILQKELDFAVKIEKLDKYLKEIDKIKEKIFKSFNTEDNQ